jgi:TonB-linked SusC/RagA family outer membrane protein
MRNFLTLMMALVISTGLYAQERIISGTITDAKTNESIPGVNMIVKGTTIGTLSGVDGTYQLEVPAGNNILVFSFVGYITREIELGDSKTVNVALEPESKSLEEIVVVGYGTKRKSLVTGAISKVEAKDLQAISSTRADQAIQGRTAGVSILPTSGSPGAGTKIRIRGTNSNGNSNPLFIVDGMKTDDINNIDPSDIASIEVLKDAASSAIYGTEGANGVVLISTKSGSEGATKINYDFQYGLQSARTGMELMNADQYTTWMEEAGLQVSNPYNANTDWLDETFEVAPMQKHYLSISGGNKKTTYLFSGSYLNQDGIVGGDKANYERYTARLNLKSDVKTWLEVGANASYAHSDRKYVGEDDEYRGVVNNALLIDPLTPVTYDGTPDHVQSLLDAGRVILQNEDGNYYGLAENVTGETANPLAVLNIYHNNIGQDKFLSNAYATIKPIEGLKITSRIGLDLTYQTQHWWSPEYYFSVENSNSSMTVDDRLNQWSTWLWENFATYETNIDEHNLSFLAGFSAEQSEGPSYSLHSGAMIVPGDEFAYHDAVDSRDFDIVGGTSYTNTMSSFFGRFTYDYMNKYMFEASVRRDGASVFPENEKYAVFPAVSAGWVFSEENFYNFEVMDYAKLRASWGQNGSKANLPGNEDKEFWTFGGIRYPDATGAFVSGAQIDKLINTNLVWETTEMTDIGLDLRFFNSKLSASVDYFYKQTKDLIAVGTGPLSVGNDYPFVNAGTVTNKGFDFELGYRNMDNEFKYGVNLNASFVDNEVTKLNVDAPVRGANVRGYDMTWFEQGQPVWYFKGYKTDGVDPQTGEIIVMDVNGDGEITPEDQTYIGDPHADVYFGGNLFAQYKNFDFNLFLQGTYGNDIFMAWYRTDRQYSNKPAYFFEDRWTPENPNADFPAANNTSDYVYRSDLMVQDGSYLRVKQIQLGYTLNKELIQKFGVNSLRAYVSLENFFTLTDYPGLDPEAGSYNNTSQGVDRGVYPAAGVFLMGVNINL